MGNSDLVSFVNYDWPVWSSSSRMRVLYHKTASSSAECSRDKPPFSFVLGEDSTMWDIVWVSPQKHRSVSVSRRFFCRHLSVPVRAKKCPCPCENGSAETTVAEGDRNRVAGLWGYTLGENWPTEPTSIYASIDFWCQLVKKSSHNGFLDVSRSKGGLRISGWIGQLSCLTIFSTSLSAAAFLRIGLAVRCWRALEAMGEV